MCRLPVWATGALTTPTGHSHWPLPLQSLSMNKSYVHKLIGSLKEMFRVGEGVCSSVSDTLGTSMTVPSSLSPRIQHGYVCG